MIPATRKTPPSGIVRRLMSTLAAPAVLCALVLAAPALAAPQAPDEVLDEEHLWCTALGLATRGF